jgi:hypothetical protein
MSLGRHRHPNKTATHTKTACNEVNVSPAAKLKVEKSAPVSPEVWIHGWTHHGQAGRTQARMNKLTREIEIKEFGKWINCHPGCAKFFTPTGFKTMLFQPCMKKRT